MGSRDLLRGAAVLPRRSPPDPLDGAMYVADLPLQAWIGFALFAVSALWTVIGNLSLTGELKRRGRPVPIFLQSMTLFVYPFYRPKQNPQATDRLAASVLIALLVALATAYFLGPFMWPESAFAGR